MTKFKQERHLRETGKVAHAPAPGYPRSLAEDPVARRPLQNGPPGVARQPARGVLLGAHPRRHFPERREDIGKNAIARRSGPQTSPVSHCHLSNPPTQFPKQPNSELNRPNRDLIWPNREGPRNQNRSPYRDGQSGCARITASHHRETRRPARSRQRPSRPSSRPAVAGIRHACGARRLFVRTGRRSACAARCSAPGPLAREHAGHIAAEWSRDHDNDYAE